MLSHRLMVRSTLLALVIGLLVASVGEAQGDRRQGGNRRPGGGSSYRGNSSREALRALQNEYLQKELKLTTAQKKRIKEIGIQMSGAAALMRSDVQKELGLSDKQKTEIREAQGSIRKQMGEMFRKMREDGKRPDFSKLREKMTEMRKKTTEDTMNVLSSAQKKTFDKMKGKPIDLEKLSPSRQPSRPSRPSRPDV